MKRSYSKQPQETFDDVDIARKPGVSKLSVVSLVLSLLPYAVFLQSSFPCIIQPRSCTWAEGFGFGVVIMAIRTLLYNIMTLILGLVALDSWRRYQKSTTKVLSIIAIVLSVGCFGAHFLLGEVVHWWIVVNGGH